MQKYHKINYLLSIFICALPPSLVMGAAIMESFIFLSCMLFFFLNFKNIGTKYYFDKFFITFFLFCIYLILSSFLSENILNSLRNTAFYFRFGIIIMIILYLLEYFKKFEYLFFISIAITLFAIIFYTFLQLFLIDNISDIYRISGLFGEESIQGSFLLRIVPIFLIFYLYNSKGWHINHKFILIIFLTLIFILILLSGERASIFLMFIGIFLAFFLLKISIKKTSLFIIYLIVVFSLTITFYSPAKERIVNRTYDQVFNIDSRVGGERESFNIFSQGHQDHLESAYIMFKQNYLTGVGVRNFRIECKKEIYKKVGKYHCSTHPHNTYLQLLSETGIIGLLFFLIFLFFIISKLYLFLNNIYFKNQAINKCLALCFVLIAVNFFPLVPTGSFFNNWLSTLYFIPVALVLNELNQKSS